MFTSVSTRTGQGRYRNFFWVTIAVLCMPLLPPIFESSHVHVNLFLVCFSGLILIVNWNNRLENYNSPFFIYLFTLQVLLALNFLLNGMDNVVLGDVPSLFRPLMLCMTFAMVRFLLPVDLEFNEYFLKVFKVFIVLSAIYFFVEMFFPEKFEQFVYGLYKRESRPDLRFVFTSFFGTSYYAGFVYFTVFAFLFPNFLVKKSFVNFSLMFLCIIFMFLNQSKLMLITLFFYLFLMFFIRRGLVGKFLTIFICIAIVLALMSLLADTQLTSGLKVSSVSSLRTLIFEPQSSGTLNVRISQITSILDLEKFFGMGLGRDEELESWIATYLFRYGIIGLVFFLIFHLVISFNLYSISNLVSLSDAQRTFLLSISLWFLLLPVSQLSSAMIEGSKFSYLYAVMCAVALHNISKYQNRSF